MTGQPGAEDLAAVAAEEKTAELSILKESLDQARAQSAGYYDQLLRLKAEFENFRKRAEKERTDARRWGKEEVLGGMLSLFDVLGQAEAALAQARKDVDRPEADVAAVKGADLKSITAGLHMLYGEFKRLLKDQGVEEIPAEGLPFDPAVHEAVETVPQEGEGGKVLGVIQKGYRLQGNLLRPARVRVSEGGKEAPKP